LSTSNSWFWVGHIKSKTDLGSIFDHNSDSIEKIVNNLGLCSHS
jgi:hypothetical protein